MRNKHSLGFALVMCALAVGLLLGSTVVAKSAEVPVESWNFELVGSVDTATGLGTVGGGYSKIAPWPYTQNTFFNTGCYENGLNVGTVGCFRVLNVANPFNPVRVATVEVFDRVNSPRPPLPNDPYWVAHPDTNVWTNDAFNNLPSSTACGDWKLPDGPGWTTGPTCWDKGWITRTHYTAGVSGDFQDGSTIYWVNSQRLSGAPSKRLSYTGVAFYDLANPNIPQFLGRINMAVDRAANGVYSNAGGVHHGFFDGRYAYLGAEESGFVAAHLVIVDAIDPANPVLVGRWWIPGQKTPEEDAIRNSTGIDPQTKLEKGWIPQSGFTPITRDATTGLLKKDYSFHYISVHKIRNKEIAIISWHQAGLIILDVTNKTNPKFLSRFDYLTPDFQKNDKLAGAQLDYAACVEENGQGSACGNAHAAKLVDGTNIVWMADEYFVRPYGHLRFFDVSNLQKPKLISHLVLPETVDPSIDYPKRTASTHLGNNYGNVLFLAWYGLGVKAVDFSDPAYPQLVGTYSYSANDGEGGQATYDVIFDQIDNYLCVTDSDDGVRILKWTGPGAMNE